MFDRLIDLLVQFIELFKFWHVVDPYEEALVLRLGKLHRHLKCGFHWILPLGIERVYDEHVVPTTHSLGHESVTTAPDEGLQIPLQAHPERVRAAPGHPGCTAVAARDSPPDGLTVRGGLPEPGIQQRLAEPRERPAVRRLTRFLNDLLRRLQRKV